jgi:hypothetical protein
VLRDDGTGYFAPDPSMGGKYELGCWTNAGSYVTSPAPGTGIDGCALAIRDFQGADSPGGYMEFETDPRVLLLTSPSNYLVYVAIVEPAH